jgi:hypothetical protein
MWTSIVTSSGVRRGTHYETEAWRWTWTLDWAQARAAAAAVARQLYDEAHSVDSDCILNEPSPV